MPNKYIGLNASGVIESADSPSGLTTPLQLGNDGRVIAVGSGESIGYLSITEDGFLEIGENPTVTIIKISAGATHSLFLMSDGTVYSCGSNIYGQLGRVVANGSQTTVNLGQIPNLTGVQALSCGEKYSLFLMSGGTVYSCGWNENGELGRAVANGNQTTVNLGQIPNLTGVQAISCVRAHNLFLMSGGTVYSCGYNGNGELGRVVASGSQTTINLGQTPGLTGVQAISGGGAHSLFLMSGGTVYSCGINVYGQLGRAVASGKQDTVNLGQIPNLTGVQAISAGRQNGIFLMSGGTVYSCGNNAAGQLGRVVANGSQTTVNLGQIPNLTGVQAISCYDSHSLFLMSGGTVYSCGNNVAGQLGRVVAGGNQTTVNLGQIPSLTGVQAISGGSAHSLFLMSGGTVYSCGYNQDGMLGRAVANGSMTAVNLGEIEFI